MEPITHGEQITDGHITGYTHYSGFGFFIWPGTFTLDLDSVRDIRCIRFLLWDGKGHPDTSPDPRKYKYRLLVSNDLDSWRVLFDTEDMGYNGWQNFLFPEGIRARYVRIHGVYNSANHHFHLVEVEVHDSEPPPLDAEVTLERVIDHSGKLDLGDRVDEHVSVPHAPVLYTEVGDGFSFSKRVTSAINAIENLVNNSKYLNPEPFRQLISELRVQVKDVAAIERSMDSVRREILSPIKKELLESSRLSKFSYWGFWVGIVGGILAIIALAVDLYYN